MMEALYASCNSLQFIYLVRRFRGENVSAFDIFYVSIDGLGGQAKYTPCVSGHDDLVEALSSDYSALHSGNAFIAVLQGNTSKGQNA